LVAYVLAQHARVQPTGTVDAVSAIDSFAGAVDEVNIEFVDELDADSDSGDSYRKFNSSKASHTACSCAFLET